jgi:hypothetical protein
MYTRLYLARRRACKVFIEQLVACGVDKSTARELVLYYPKIDLMFAGSE